MDIAPIGSGYVPNQAQPAANRETRAAETPRTAATAVKQAAPEQTSRQKPEDLKKAVDSMNEFASNLSGSLRFSIDDDTGQTIVKVIDSSTKEVIKQIPTEEMLAISKSLDKLKGLLVQQKV